MIRQCLILFLNVVVVNVFHIVISDYSFFLSSGFIYLSIIKLKYFIIVIILNKCSVTVQHYRTVLHSAYNNLN